MQQAGALRSGRRDAEGTEIVAATPAEDVERRPPEPAPKRPRDAAYADGALITSERLDWRLLVLADHRLHFQEGPILRGSDQAEEDDVLAGQPAFDVQSDDAVG